ncbi:glutathione peroxidase [Myxococcota bacterium]|nr:glutathione peroxidase [Myxococcota bacterium]MBU1381179.1 glutathione peroxidase [Myxococcota bacterium]MBU1498785.1 glutathione peroxidase [Myxococcota bacterium]
MSIYDLSFNDSKGHKIEMSQYKGKVLLLVNTATKCGLAPQFKILEDIYQKYKNKDFFVIGFPCNQFANQEPETNETMAETCQINFGVTFLLSEKIYVNGENTHPVFAYLKDNSKSGLFGKKIKWNFTKFLVSADGTIIKRYSPTKNPKKIEKDIETLLK